MEEDPSFQPSLLPPSEEADNCDSLSQRCRFTPMRGEAGEAFDRATGNLKICYLMMSVALDEAFCQREQCELVRARAQAGISADLAKRLEGHLLRLFCWLKLCGKQIPWGFGARELDLTVDHCEFRHKAGHEAVRAEGVLRLFMLTKRHRYLHELRALETAVTEITKSFQLNAQDIAEGTCIQPQECWRELNELHEDLNTCVRKAQGLLRFVLRTIPPVRLPPLLRELGEYSEEAIKPKLDLPSRPLPARPLRAST